MRVQKRISMSRERRTFRVANRIKRDSTRPRLSIFRSSKHMYAQIIDDEAGRTLVSASTRDKSIQDEVAKKTGNKTAAAAVGRVIAQRAVEAGITQVAFDPAALPLPRARGGSGATPPASRACSFRLQGTRLNGDRSPQGQVDRSTNYVKRIIIHPRRAAREGHQDPALRRRGQGRPPFQFHRPGGRRRRPREGRLGLRQGRTKFRRPSRRPSRTGPAACTRSPSPD